LVRTLALRAKGRRFKSGPAHQSFVLNPGLFVVEQKRTRAECLMESGKDNGLFIFITWL